MVRFGLFGTGHWAGETHGAGVDAHPRAALVGVWGRDPAKAAALAQRYGVPAFEDADALIDACDAVAVALPPDVQADIATRAAVAGRHLLLDKPLALTLADADRVVAAARASGIASLVFFTQRYHPNVTAFLAATAADGGWQHARATLFASIYQPGNPYGASAWRREHGGLWDVGPHALSLILPVLGRATRVAAMSGPRGLVHLLLTHEGGATSTVSLTLDAPGEAVTRDVVFYGDSGIETAPLGKGTVADAYGAAIDQLLEEIESGTRDHRLDVRFGREVVAVLAAAETARTEARVVDVPA
ncbi:Gfo/Idh/MocA family oxidoreductase [Micromonospora sp. WMMA1363]|uniref:Gfo/Idh/MocA family protein n=1 Tax=Micromonospora sp. WMMA1363 TaxID=3053985 RepID=UPI00259CD431|nr:Gfo/Idh/MocA family oxidoreductase [Micromonospora sp. WMMA1363]MDM4720554.1 Gfo/Idh/MocA family oxidoreductase [Micromonospora sp. WMMA1363]